MNINVASIHADYFEIQRNFIFPLRNETPFYIVISAEEIRNFEDNRVRNLVEGGWLLNSDLSIGLVGDPTYDKGETDIGYFVRYNGNEQQLNLRYWQWDCLFNQKTQTNDRYQKYPAGWEVRHTVSVPGLVLYQYALLKEKNLYLGYDGAGDTYVKEASDYYYSAGLKADFNSIGIACSYETKYEQEGISYTNHVTQNYQDSSRTHLIEPHIKIQFNDVFQLENIMQFRLTNYQRNASSDIRYTDFDAANYTVLNQKINRELSIDYGYALIKSSHRNKWGKQKLIFNLYWLYDTYALKFINSFHVEDINREGLKWDGSGVLFRTEF